MIATTLHPYVLSKLEEFVLNDFLFSQLLQGREGQIPISISPANKEVLIAHLTKYAHKQPIDISAAILELLHQL